MDTCQGVSRSVTSAHPASEPSGVAADTFHFWLLLPKTGRIQVMKGRLSKANKLPLCVSCSAKFGIHHVVCSVLASAERKQGCQWECSVTQGSPLRIRGHWTTHAASMPHLEKTYANVSWQHLVASEGLSAQERGRPTDRVTLGGKGGRHAVAWARFL